MIIQILAVASDANAGMCIALLNRNSVFNLRGEPNDSKKVEKMDSE